MIQGVPPIQSVRLWRNYRRQELFLILAVGFGPYLSLIVTCCCLLSRELHLWQVLLLWTDNECCCFLLQGYVDCSHRAAFQEVVLQVLLRTDNQCCCLLLQGYVDCSNRAAFQEIVLRIQDAPKWSPTVLDCKVRDSQKTST